MKVKGFECKNIRRHENYIAPYLANLGRVRRSTEICRLPIPSFYKYARGFVICNLMLNERPTGNFVKKKKNIHLISIFCHSRFESNIGLDIM